MWSENSLKSTSDEVQSLKSRKIVKIIPKTLPTSNAKQTLLEAVAVF